MSHEASSTLATMAVDLSEDLQIYFDKWKAAKGSGVSQLIQFMEIDHTKSHPFRVGVLGRPRLYFIVPDGQGEIIEGEFGQTLVAQPKDSEGFVRARYEIPIYNHKNSGQKKIDDDFVDALRGLANIFMVMADGKTPEEEFEEEMDEQGLNKQELMEEGDLSKIQARIIQERAFVQKQNRSKSGGSFRPGSPGRVRSRKR
jgi:hypothetical protein